MQRQEVTVVGRQNCPMTHDVIDYLTRNHVLYRWVSLDEDRQLCAQLGVSDESSPAVLVGEQLSVQPTTDELALLLGTRTSPSLDRYDLAIIGAGPAGLSAAVIAASEGLTVCLLEARAPGGQAARSHRIENYLGYADGLSGPELGHQGRQQAERLGAEFVQAQVWMMLPLSDGWRLYLGNNLDVEARAVLVATGQTVGRLEAPGADELTGGGIYYGAPMAEVKSCQGGHAMIVGGGNSAGQGALCLADHAEQVTVVLRGGALADHMSHYLVERLVEHPRISVVTQATISKVEEVEGGVQVSIRRPRKEHVEVVVQGLFVFIGQKPNTTFLPAETMRDADGFILTGAQVGSDLLCETSELGLFAAGDVRSGCQQRVATAVADGTVAVNSIRQYLSGRRW